MATTNDISIEHSPIGGVELRLWYSGGSYVALELTSGDIERVRNILKGWRHDRIPKDNLGIRIAKTFG